MTPFLQKTSTQSSLPPPPPPRSGWWYFQRLSGLALLAMALFHLIYMLFLTPGGAAAVNYNGIAARWLNPTWGFTWRIFDLLLLLLGLAHGGYGIWRVWGDAVPGGMAQKVGQAGLLALCLALLAGGAAVIFFFPLHL